MTMPEEDLVRQTSSASGHVPQRLLFAQFTAIPSGSPTSGLMIASALNSAGWHVDAVFGEGGPMLARYKAAGCNVRIAQHGQWLAGGGTLRRLRRWSRDLRKAYRFLRLMQDLKPDLVYVNTLMGLAPALAARVLGIPCIWHIRELFTDVGGEVHDPLGGRRMVRWVLRVTASRVIAISQAVVDNIQGSGLSPAATIIPNAVTEDFFTFSAGREESRRLLNLPVDGSIIGVPGMLRPVKGHPLFLNAAALVSARISGCRFVFSGDGQPKYRQSLLDQIQELGLGDRVQFLGTQTDMRPFYRACDVVCVPSVSESFGRTVIEAFALDVPVVATQVGGMAETVEDGGTGFLEPFGDCAALADRLIRLLEDPGLRRTMAAAARHQAEALYREDVYQRRILQVVEDVMRDAGSPRFASEVPVAGEPKLRGGRI